MGEEAFDRRREAALEYLQESIHALGPVTDESQYVVREPVLDLIDQIYSVGEELKEVRFDLN